RNVELGREVPAGLIEQQNGMRSRGDGLRDFGQMQRHCGGIAARQDEASGTPLGRADGPKDVGRAGALIVRRGRPRPPPCPPPGDLVLLANPSLVLEPDFYRLACRVTLGDLVEAGGEVFLNATTQSRTVCNPTPPIRAASVRDPPS